MMGRIMQMLDGMDEDQARNMLDQLDDEQLQQGLQRLMDMYIVPHLEDVRHNVAEYPDADDVREAYTNAPESQQQEIFDEAVLDLMVTARLIRERPTDGFHRLKTYLRDPATTEALLLIFENEAIDEAYREQLKDYAAMHLHWAGVFLLPAMYSKEEVRDVTEEFNMELPDEE